MTRTTTSAWVVLVPVKRADIAKSRLTGVSSQQRRELARAFPADCVEAALSAPAVRDVVTITDDEVAAATFRELGARVIADEPDAGLNAALEHAADHARRHYDDPPVAVLSGDLPALRADALDSALDRARGSTRAFLADSAGDGTTLLTAPPGVPLEPHFGPDSRRQHLASGAREIEPQGLESVRRDVDTPADLRDALALGVGRHTSAVLERHGLTREADRLG
jgi:2-phospho-L-lactate/phosphoenolpyruvate guanylyltransferase